MTTTVSRNPTGDEAVSGTWTGTAGSRYLVVDDFPDTTPTDELIHGTTAGNLTFTFTAFSIPSEAANISVAVRYVDAKNGTQGNNIAARLKVGGAYYASATHSPTNNSYVQRTDTFATNPRTSAAWTVAQVNGTDGSNSLQAFGWVSTDASPTIDLTSIRLDVTYDRDLTLVGEVGTFTETGQAASTITGRIVNGEVGTFTEDGQTANTITGRVVSGEAGSLAQSGQDAVFEFTPSSAVTYQLNALAGEYTVGNRTWATGGWDTTYWGDVGENAILTYEREIQTESGAYVLTGQTAGLQVGHYLSGGAGTFIETGQAAGLLQGYAATGEAGGFTTSGQSAGTLRGAQASGAAAAFTVTGQSAGTLRGSQVTGDAGAYTTTGQAATFARPGMPLPMCAGSRPRRWCH